MKKLVTNDLLFLQKKLESLDTKEYREEFTQENLEIFRQDILNTMGLVLRKTLGGV